VIEKRIKAEDGIQLLIENFSSQIESIKKILNEFAFGEKLCDTIRPKSGISRSGTKEVGLAS
jgi:hypothetical protein